MPVDPTPEWKNAFEMLAKSWSRDYGNVVKILFVDDEPSTGLTP